ncbi:MAG: hypothetical protein ACXACD_21905 [Candidatus Thorarchaeota archaeon]|jgi:hypothetical protein
MSNFIKSYQANVGLNHAPAYQVSGQPFASGSINAATATKVEFPYVTRWIYVVNRGGADVRVGFSQAGVEGTNYFVVEQSEDSQRLELKVSELWISGSGVVDVVAGLTSVPSSRTTTDDGPSWSGSAGVG